MNLLILFLVFTSAVSFMFNAASAEDEHLCIRLTRGDLHHLDIRGFSKHTPGEMLLFAGGNSEEGKQNLYVYRVPMAQVTSNSFGTLPQDMKNWNDGELATLGNNFHKQSVNQDQRIKSIWVLKKQANFAPVILRTKSFLELWKKRDVEVEAGNPEHFIIDDAGLRPPFEILHDGELDSSFIIQRDPNVSLSEHTIFYPLSLDLNSDGTAGRWINAAIDDDAGVPYLPVEASFYYLALNPDPRYISFVYRYHKDKQSLLTSATRLFNGKKIPQGFYHQNRLFLFDSLLACVYVISFDHAFNFASRQEHFTASRLANVPYEKYFKCPERYHWADLSSKFAPNRCDPAVSNNGPPSPLPSPNPEPKPASSNAPAVLPPIPGNPPKTDSKWWQYLIICLLAILIIGGTFAIYRYIRKKKQQKRATKMGKLVSSTKGIKSTTKLSILNSKPSGKSRLLSSGSKSGSSSGEAKSGIPSSGTKSGIPSSGTKSGIPSSGTKSALSSDIKSTPVTSVDVKSKGPSSGSRSDKV